MIKLQDFARERGVTDRAIQKLLRKYADEFEGLVQRRGPNGTWLTDGACALLQEKMRQAPVVVAERDEEVERWRRKYEETMENFAAYMQHASPLLETAARQSLLLEQSNAQIGALEAQNADLSAELSRAREIASQAQERAQAASDELTAAQQRIAELEGRKWYHLLFKKVIV